jgi:hypothetical protein
VHRLRSWMDWKQQGLSSLKGRFSGHYQVQTLVRNREVHSAMALRVPLTSVLIAVPCTAASPVGRMILEESGMPAEEANGFLKNERLLDGSKGDGHLVRSVPLHSLFGRGKGADRTAYPPGAFGTKFQA